MKHNRIVRRARSSDAAALLEIYEPHVRHSATNFEFDPPSEVEFAARIEAITTTDPWLVLERNDEIVGFAYATAFRSRPAYATTRETTVYVHRAHNRAGVGRDLMVALLEELRRQGTRLAVAVIALPNDASVALHESLGFTGVGIIHNVARKFDTWHDEGFWELPLSSG